MGGRFWIKDQDQDLDDNVKILQQLMMLFTKVCQQQRHGSGLSLEEANIWSVAPPILARGAAAAARGKK